MKALVLSGGKGTRLRPITHTYAKQLVPVANKPILFYVLENIAKLNIKDVGIIVGDTGEEVKAAVGDGSRWHISVTYIYQDQPLGLAHAVKVAQRFLQDEPFLMYLGDNILLEDLSPLVQKFNNSSPNAIILLTEVANPSEFGVATLNEKGEVIKLVEKPREPESNLALVGVYLFDRHVHKAIEHLKPSWRGELEITDAIQWLIDNNFRVESHIVSGWWKDTGKVEDLLEANRIILDTQTDCIKGELHNSTAEFKVVIEKDAVVKGSKIRGPAIIGKGARIVDSYIGPFTSVAPGVEIVNSEIEHSIIMEGSRIVNAGRIIDSLIGREVIIQRSQNHPRAHRFIVGDRSDIELL